MAVSFYTEPNGHKDKNMKKGFTLIELLVVVLIMGILAAVALPQYQKAVEKSRVAEAVTVLNTLQNAIDIYVLEHGTPSEDIAFLGTANTLSGYTNGNGLLSVDLLNCVVDNEGCCSTKDFMYHAVCFSSGSCQITASRNGPNASCGDVYAGLTLQKNNAGWSKTCTYSNPEDYSESKFWDAICNDMQHQGWVPYEY